MPKIGVGIITYNRIERLKLAVAQVRALTQSEYELVVADDGSADGTAAWCRQNGVRVVTGDNRGVCWNKNRALYGLLALGCDPILLLEDDARPVAPGWEDLWRRAAALWGHVSYAHPKIAAQVIEGTGTPEDPCVNLQATGQCASMSASGLEQLGYLDTRFKGYGVGHAEWTSRAKRLGLGFKPARLADGTEAKANLYIDGGIVADDAPSFRDDYAVARNRAVNAVIRNEPVFRSPWSSREERKIFLQEQAEAGIPALPQASGWPDAPQSSADWEEKMLGILHTQPPPKKKKDRHDADGMQRMRWDIERRLPEFRMKVFLDVGAHLGATVKSVRSVFPDSAVHAFEPAPETYQALCPAWTNDEAVHCLNLALGAEAGAAKMIVQGTEAKNHIAAAGTQEVAVVRGDAWLREAGIDRVSYLKIDTAGHDWEALAGFEDSFAAAAIDLVELTASLHPTNVRQAPFLKIKAFLEAKGYQVFSLRNGEFDTRPYLRHCTMTFISARLVREQATPRA